MPHSTSGYEILWDVVEEHLEEAEFLFSYLLGGLHSPLFTLPEVVSGPEQRLLAHIDGLVVGGDRVAQTLLIPALDAVDDPPKVTAAAWALLCDPKRRYDDQIVARLSESDEELAQPIVTALQFCPRTDLMPILASKLRGSAAPPMATRMLDVLWGRGLTVPEVMSTLLRSDDENVVVASCRAARFAPRAAVLRDLEVLTAHQSPLVRAAAIESSVVHGSLTGWSACLREVPTADPRTQRRLMALAATAGDERLQAWLESALADDSLGPAGLFAAGVSGRPALVPHCLALLDGDHGKLAAEAICRIAGLPTAAPYFVDGDPPVTADELVADAPDPPEDESDRDKELVDVERSDDDLPEPVAAAIHLWWQESGSRLDPKRRYVYGALTSPATLARAAREGPTRRLESIGQELAVRTRGATSLRPVGLGSDVLASVRALDSGSFDCQVSYERIS